MLDQVNILRLGVYDVRAHVLKLVNVGPGQYTTRICDSINRERKRTSVYMTSDPVCEKENY